MNGTTSPSSPDLANSSRSRSNLARPALVHDPHRQPGLAEQRPALAPRPVERARPLAAARDQKVERAAAGLGNNAKKLLADRQPGDFRPPLGEIGGRLRKRDQRPRHKPPDHPVGKPGNRVGLHHHHRNAPQQRRHHRRPGDIPTHAEDGGDAAHQPEAAERGKRQSRKRAIVSAAAPPDSTRRSRSSSTRTLQPAPAWLPARARSPQRTLDAPVAAIPAPPPAPE